MNLSKRAVKYLYSKYIRLARRDQTPYASHVPILIGVSNLVQPSKIVEFGSGEFSTLSFIDPRTFPHLKILRSFENDREWHARIAERVTFDSRARVELVSGAIASAVTSHNLDGAELIFVDDSDVEGRIGTIEAIARFHPDNVPVIVHDYDLRRLRRAGRLFESCFCFNVWNPQTAVLWNGDPEWPKRLGCLAKVLRQNLNLAPLHDSTVWRQALTSIPVNRVG